MASSPLKHGDCLSLKLQETPLTKHRHALAYIYLCVLQYIGRRSNSSSTSLQHCIYFADAVMDFDYACTACVKHKSPAYKHSCFCFGYVCTKCSEWNRKLQARNINGFPSVSPHALLRCYCSHWHCSIYVRIMTRLAAGRALFLLCSSSFLMCHIVITLDPPLLLEHRAMCSSTALHLAITVDAWCFKGKKHRFLQRAAYFHYLWHRCIANNHQKFICISFFKESYTETFGFRVL